MTSQGLRAAADVVALARRSIVGVRAVSSGGTGWICLGNGLVMTSHEAVGYQIEVFLEVEGGKRSGGRVIWVDVARDLALVLPAERLDLPPLLARPDLPRIGEGVIALSAVPDEPFRAVPAAVSAVDVKLGALRCFEIDAVPGSSGGPIVDLDGRLLGVGGLDLPRGARRRAGAKAASRSPALPIAALERALETFDLAPDKFAERAPEYGCPACAEPYAVEDDRCLACGQRLPHAWDVEGGDEPAIAGAEQATRELLGELGAVASSVRVGPRSFRLLVPLGEGATLSELLLDIDERGSSLRGKIALIHVPAARQEALYRFLLTLNDQNTRSLRLSIEGDTVFLGFAEPLALLRNGEGAARFQELVRDGERYRKALAETFEAVLVA